MQESPTHDDHPSFIALLFVRMRMGPQLREQESCSDPVQSTCLEILENPERFKNQGDVAFKDWPYGVVLHKI